MKTQKNMFFAFILNFTFSIFEFIGGMVSGSFAVTSDAFHDAADALGIGVSLLLEKKSRRPPDEKYTYGYGNYSLIGALFTTLILLVGSVLIIANAVMRIISPVRIEYGKMIAFAIFGVVINALAAFVTRGKDSANQRAVNLHMLEDVLGWICVLLGAVVMHFTDFYILDPIMSIAVSSYIILHSLENIRDVFDVFLAKVPKNTDVFEIRQHLLQTDGVEDVHHLHIWSHANGQKLATLHIVASGNAPQIKEKVREEFKKHGIHHVTLELEKTDEICHEKACLLSVEKGHTCCHSHGHLH
ncbi:MAG: cation transporter [Ruminococcaceae bacterium]|nr:cation transporter [Oscillospiraceae bacterium]